MIMLCLCLSFAQKLYVVERERGTLAVIEKDELKKEIGGLGDLNHATVKFLRKRAYVISRDGYLSMIDTSTDRLLRKVKVGESTIGLTFCGDKVAVANYSPKTVLLLSSELSILHRFETGSRNVGIKSYGKLLVFSLMDRDEVWVVDCEDLSIVERFERVGDMPFDALLSGNSYVVGFFGESAVGLLNLDTMTYKKVRFRKSAEEIVLKIPHFGLWGVLGDTAYIPAVGERKIHIVSLKDFSYIGSLELPGLPVFAAVSPNGRFLAVNYSGDMEDYLSLIDVRNLHLVETRKLGRRILHFRFSQDSEFIYVSSYYENKVKKVSVPDLKPVKDVSVPTPSGVFIEGG